ncbi:MAG: hypothetical protein P4M08_08400 [Oligoflexia bacterium]|nr:hypothetical protein [Oligoflexia bacterium]
MRNIYLAKAGKNHGPFDQTEIDAMRKSGELSDYSWIWNVARAAWEPIDHAPAPLAPPTDNQEATIAPTPASAPQAQPRMQAQAAPAPSARLFHIPDEVSSVFQAVCYDHLSVLSGHIKKAGENGCDFVTDSHDSSPIFMKDMPVQINILDPATGGAMSVRAQVLTAVRDDGHWKYRLAWNACPEIIMSHANAA